MSAVPAAAPAPTVTTVIDPDRMGVKVTVGLPASATALSVWRVATASGHKAFVRGWENGATAATTLDIYDWEVPLGVEVTYYAQATVAGAASDTGASAPLTVSDARDWLVDLARPTNTQPILVEAMPEASYGGPVGVHRILDRRDPVLTTAPLWTPTATLSFITATQAEADRALAILGGGVAFLLRTPPEHGVGNLYLGVTGLRQQRLSRLAVHADRRFVAEVVQVARPDPSLYVPQPPVSYQALKDTYATYQAVVDTGLSYQELSYQFDIGEVDPNPDWPPTDV